LPAARGHGLAAQNPASSAFDYIVAAERTLKLAVPPQQIAGLEPLLREARRRGEYMQGCRLKAVEAATEAVRLMDEFRGDILFHFHSTDKSILYDLEYQKAY
jgi:hypothetical protein